MKTVFVFTTSSGRAKTEMITGVREFFNGTEWDIQNFEYEGKSFPVRELVKFWSPIGCIVEISGNGLVPNTFPKGAFGTTPVVYLGGDSTLTPAKAIRVVHDAQDTANLVTRELLQRHDLRQFAFVGLRGHAWSLRRETAFVRALQLNGKIPIRFNLNETSSNSHRLELNRIREWLIQLKKPCGLFAADDTIAKSVLAIGRSAAISVPDDLAVIGVDDNEEICNNTKPTLTSVRPDFRQAGRFSARLLARKILRSCK